MAAAALPLVLPAAPASAQQVGCVEIPTFNEACPAWFTSYDSPALCTEDPERALVGPDGIYLVATRSCGGGFDILVLAYRLDGSMRWLRTYEGEAGGRDYAHGAALSPDGGRLFIVGSEDTGESYDWVTIAYDTANGDELWAANHDGPLGEDDEAWVAAASEDGERLYVAGLDVAFEDDGNEVNTLLVAYEAATGERDWLVRFDGDPSRHDHPRAIGVSGDRVVVTGSSLRVLGTQDLQTVVYRDDREEGRAVELWRAGYDGGDWDQPVVPCLTRTRAICGMMGSVAVTGDIVAVAATSFVDPATDDAVWTTIGYDLETGERLWLNRFGDPTLQNKANTIAASPDGDTIYVTGFTNDELVWDGVGDLAAVAYDAHSGQERWRVNYALPAVEDASGFGLAASDHEVYVTGTVEVWPQQGVRADSLTLAYDADSGDRLWLARHSRESEPGGLGDNDGGNWPSLTADGTRLVIGSAISRTFRVEQQTDFRDIGLLAYDV